ncbi:MAG: hypothetical protein A2Z91_00910 [Deltaproteobacteria bacterium GWA2_38_16]|nr:MAG: hypothetical protein A2Z91_00910 [Deltaproteobacteria bacterium GWA2_38_16]OGQ03657.1 MAG: hypothetical protein A3D19_02315 [Deltaproteobacteria bacterium RIFCSPHIGHO2_02_FULL_38_15]OGQ62833.1 MAG: hypothetical protein A3G92_02180 [Deltaproteobacteria bacterium RIFCSPLOWO2_12_FULL_38_8]HBQ21821.1 hypothetical protein [Deltaproteobacteria bacterium]
MINFKVIFLALILFLSPFLTSAEDLKNLDHPKGYSLALWYYFLQREDMPTLVHQVISEAHTILKNKDVILDKKIVISKTPESHLTQAQDAFALPFTLFLEEEAPRIIALHIAALSGGKDWAYQKLGIKKLKAPEWHAKTNYLEKLRSSYSLKPSDFLGTDDLKNYTIRFRVLTDQEGLMVPVEKESSLIELLEGGVDAYPIEEVPLTKLVNHIELQMINSLIKDIQFKTMDNDRSIAIGESLVTLFAWIIIDRRLQLIRKGWLRGSSRILLFIGSFFIFDTSAHYFNDPHTLEKSKYEETLFFLKESLENAHIGNFNVEEFKRDFCYSLNLFDHRSEEMSQVEEKLTHYYTQRTDMLKYHLELVTRWLTRLENSPKRIDSNTGEIVYDLPLKNQDPIILTEEEKNQLEADLKKLKQKLPGIIATYELLQKDPSSPF